MADKDKLILAEIQTKYVPFLEKLIAFLEKNNKVSKDNLNRLKSIYTVFTTASEEEQIQVFNTNKKKLEKWYKNPKKGKTNNDSDSSSTQGSKRHFMEDTDSSQGETAPVKRSKTTDSSKEETPSFDPSLVLQIKKEKGDAPKVAPVAASAAAGPVSIPSALNDKGELMFTCASCQYQSTDEQEFMKHTRTDHRSDLSMWCKLCGKCFSNAGVLVAHIKERACVKEDMVYKCGVKDCIFETGSGQTFVHHLRHCHKGSPFIFCVHCQKIFTLPHCLILHMQDDCPYKERNRRHPGSMRPAPSKPSTPSTQAPKPVVNSFASGTPTIASVTSGVRLQATLAPKPATPSTRGGLLPSSRGRGSSTPTPRSRGRGRGRGRQRHSESSDSDDPDDPSWKPEELAGQSMLRRSGRFAKKVNDAQNVTPKSTDKHFPSEELNSKEMIKCPCCDYLAAFKSVLEDHYIALHKVPNKNACQVCNLKFESNQGFIDHFADHESGKLPNSVMSVSPVTVQEDSNSTTEEVLQPTPKAAEAVEKAVVQPSEKVVLDEELVQSVVKNISEANVINMASDKNNLFRIPYQASISERSSQDSKLKKFDELKSPSDLLALKSPLKLKCFYKCVMYSCTFTTHDGDKFEDHSKRVHEGKRLHCTYCLREFLSGDVLVKHMMSEHSKRLFQCSKCFYRACSTHHVKVHIQHHHTGGDDANILTCDPVKVSNDVTIKGEPTENTTWPYVCAIGECVFQSFDLKAFKVHNEIDHRTVSVFFCHYCKVDFISFKRLLDHYRLHGINALQCNYCIHGAESKEDIFLHLCNSHADYPMRAFKRGLPEESTLPPALSNDTAKTDVHPAVDSPRSEGASSETESAEGGNFVDYEAQLYEVVGETYYPKYLKTMATDLVCGVPFCHEKFDSLLTYIGHLSNGHAAVNFPCPHCPCISEDWDAFKNHLMCHGPELFACGLVTCNFYDWGKNVVTKHVDTHSQSTAKVVIIREATAADADVHKLKSLPQSYSAKLSGTSYQCLFCRYKSSDKSVMKNHLYNELMYRRFKCDSCDEKCVSRKEMKEHYLKQHSGQEIKCAVYPDPALENVVQQFLNLNVAPPEAIDERCGHCKKHFKSMIHLQLHLYLCLRKQYQPYDCNYCASSFPDVMILKFHTDEKHPGKPLSFSEVSSHLVEDALATKLQLVRLKHLKDVTNNDSSDASPICFVKYYACGACNYESNHKHNTQIHIETSHEGQAVEMSKTLRNVSMPDLTDSQFKEVSAAPKTKAFRCGFCIKRLHTLEELEKHVEGAHSVRDEAEYMYYYSPDTQNLLGDKKEYECSYCKSGKDCLAALKKHSDLIHPASPFRVRGFVSRISSTLACAYCYLRMDSVSTLKDHTTSQHPGMAQKTIGGFRSTTKRTSEDSSTEPNKRVRFSSHVCVCSHCGAAYSSKDQVAAHSKKSHARLPLLYSTVQEGQFYKCEFCQFTGEQQHLEHHLLTKHKNRVTCGHCDRRFEFASRLREHHDAAHRDLPVKYVQETIPKKESAVKTPKLASSDRLYVRTDGFSDSPDTKLALDVFAQLFNISPRVVIKRWKGKETGE